MTVLQKIIKELTDLRDKYAQKEGLYFDGKEDGIEVSIRAVEQNIPAEEQQIRDTMFFGLETGLNESSTAPYRELETYIQVLTGKICGCGECSADYQHKSDCAVHNEPALPKGECDCKPV